MKKNFKVVMLLLILIATLIAEASTLTQTNAIQLQAQETSRANNLISKNMNLQLWQNISSQYGVGTVKNVVCEFQKSGRIVSRAEILVNLPLTSDLRSNQIVTVKYYGGKIGNSETVVTKDWPYFPNDTILPPSVFNLREGMSILFFANKTSTNLLGYTPYSVSASDADEIATAPMFESQPSTHVDESEGYGFGWDGYVVEWGDLPLLYYLDPEGTNDIDGSGTTREFDAIHSSAYTWNDAPSCGYEIEISDSTEHNYATYDEYGDWDGYNVIGLVQDFEGSNIGENPRRIVNGYIIESDIVLNDNYAAWSIGGGILWWEYDVESVVTHEMGHTLGHMNLETSTYADQTMHVPVGNGVSARTLEWGDLNGAHYMYPEHNDAGCGGDGSDDFYGATFVDRSTTYYGRLCNLPSETDTEDWYKFYAVSGQYLSIVLSVPDNANFDLKLYNPSNELVATSENSGNGADETINRNPMGDSGYWRIKVYTTETDKKESNGQYEFHIYDFLSRYVSSIQWAGTISGNGLALDDNMIGSSPDGNCASLYTTIVGDAAGVTGILNSEKSGNTNIYLYGYKGGFGYSHVYVYVSENNNYDWYYVNDFNVYSSSPTTIYAGSIEATFNYICIVSYNTDESWSPNIFNIDCVIVTN